MSRKATLCSSSYTLCAGALPAMMLQKTQLGSVILCGVVLGELQCRLAGVYLSRVQKKEKSERPSIMLMPMTTLSLHLLPLLRAAIGMRQMVSL